MEILKEKQSKKIIILLTIKFNYINNYLLFTI